MLCIQNTAVCYYGAITVFSSEDIEYSECEGEYLIKSEYIPTHFILIPDTPYNKENGFKLVKQSE